MWVPGRRGPGRPAEGVHIFKPGISNPRFRNA